MTNDAIIPAPPKLLSLKDIVNELQTQLGQRVTYDRLLGFANAPGVKEALGAQNVPGGKGARYPESAVGLFGNLLRSQDQGLVQPATAGAWLANTTQEAGTAASTSLVRVSGGNVPATVQLSPESIKALAEAINAEAAKYDLDNISLLTCKEVAAILKRGETYVRSLAHRTPGLKPWMPGRYRKIDVITFLNSQH